MAVSTVRKPEVLSRRCAADTLDMLHALESAPQHFINDRRGFACQVPSKATLDEAIPQNGVSLQDLPSISLTSPRQCFDLVNELITLIASGVPSPSAPATSTSRLIRNWAIDGLDALWTMPRSASRLIRESSERSYICTVSTLRTSLSELLSLRFEADNVDRASNALSNCMLCAIKTVTQRHRNRFPSVNLQRELCWAAFEISRVPDTWPEAFREYLTAAATMIEQTSFSESASNTVSKDFRLVLEFVTTIDTDDTPRVDAASASLDDETLGKELNKLRRSSQAIEESDRPSKRRRLLNGERKTNGTASAKFIPLSSPDSPQVLENLTDLGEDFSRAALEAFPHMLPEKQCEFLACFGKVACLNNGAEEPISCQSCDKTPRTSPKWHCMTDDAFEKLYRLLLELVRIIQQQKRTAPRIAAMVSLKRILLHTTCKAQLTINSQLGQWCLHSLQSSNRELRIAAMYVNQFRVCATDPTDTGSEERSRVLSMIELVLTLFIKIDLYF